MVKVRCSVPHLVTAMALMSSRVSSSPASCFLVAVSRHDWQKALMVRMEEPERWAMNSRLSCEMEPVKPFMPGSWAASSFMRS